MVNDSRKSSENEQYFRNRREVEGVGKDPEGLKQGEYDLRRRLGGTLVKRGTCIRRTTYWSTSSNMTTTFQELSRQYHEPRWEGGNRRNNVYKEIRWSVLLLGFLLLDHVHKPNLITATPANSVHLFSYIHHLSRNHPSLSIFMELKVPLYVPFLDSLQHKPDPRCLLASNIRCDESSSIARQRVVRRKSWDSWVFWTLMCNTSSLFLSSEYSISDHPFDWTNMGGIVPSIIVDLPFTLDTRLFSSFSYIHSNISILQGHPWQVICELEIQFTIFPGWLMFVCQHCSLAKKKGGQIPFVHHLIASVFCFTIFYSFQSYSSPGHLPNDLVDLSHRSYSIHDHGGYLIVYFYILLQVNAIQRGNLRVGG